MPIPYSQNMLKNPSAETGDTSEWQEVSNVSAVQGGVQGGYCFKFGAVASMKQSPTVPGQPPRVFFETYFLPGQDVSTAAPVYSEVVVTLTYGDGVQQRYTIPVKVYG